MQTQLLQTINCLTGNSGKKILFASMPMDGHFNPLTGLAVHLQGLGYEVKWYTGTLFAPKLRTLGIPHLPFRKAKEVTQHNIDEVFPERKNIKGMKRLSFDMSNYFILRGPEFLEDVSDIQEEFPFDLLIADICFTGIPFIRRVLNKPVIAVGVIPLVEASEDVAPPGLGLPPARTLLGKKGYQLLAGLVNNVLLKHPNQLLLQLLSEHGIRTKAKTVFDIIIETSSVVLQVGSPGFEYKRRKISPHIRFIGPLLPYAQKETAPFPFEEKLRHYKQVLLLTQGTMEPIADKLIIPALEAFKNTDKLVLVATAGNHTAALRERYPFANIVIEDYIDFRRIMPHVDVYISNGGYGGVLLSIMSHLPMVVGGKYEGKNEICTRVGYFNLGINLKTEVPKKEAIRKAVERVLADPGYKKNVQQLSKELSGYSAEDLCAQAVRQLTGAATVIHPAKAIAESN